MTDAEPAFRIEVTAFRKDNGGLLSKHIELINGKISNDSSACFMSRGKARRVPIASVQELANFINAMKPSDAYALGRLRDGCHDRVHVVTAANLDQSNPDSAIIARTKKYLIFAEGEPGIALLDTDLKGMPDSVRQRIEESGGPEGAGPP
jgi:hypothetical protein